MKQKLKKIKELLEKSIDDSTKKDLYIGQALGLLDSLIIDTNSGGDKLPIPDAVRNHMSNSRDEVMMNAVQRHKEVHKELSKNSVTQKNTQFEQLK